MDTIKAKISCNAIPFHVREKKKRKRCGKEAEKKFLGKFSPMKRKSGDDSDAKKQKQNKTKTKNKQKEKLVSQLTKRVEKTKNKNKRISMYLTEKT